MPYLFRFSVCCLAFISGFVCFFCLFLPLPLLIEHFIQLNTLPLARLYIFKCCLAATLGFAICICE